MSLEEARKKLVLLQYELFYHADLTPGSSVRISKKLLKAIEELEKEIAKPKNKRAVPEGDDDLQVVY